MKPLALFTAFVGLCFGASLAPCLAEYLPPKRKSLSSYLDSASRNPFGIASKKETVTTEAGFAKNLYINGIMDFDGEKTIYVADKNTKSVFSLGKDRSHEGIELVEVDISPTVGSSTVIIRKGSETAKLAFDQAQMFSSKGVELATAKQQPKPNATQQRAKSTKIRKPRPVRIIRAPKKGP